MVLCTIHSSEIGSENVSYEYKSVKHFVAGMGRPASTGGGGIIAVGGASLIARFLVTHAPAGSHSSCSSVRRTHPPSSVSAMPFSTRKEVLAEPVADEIRVARLLLGA